ncbi:MAG TPA: DUF6221 family protein [Streptosporangiaceae bacterium]
MTADLVAFIRARLDEDEAIATAAAEQHQGSATWRADLMVDHIHGEGASMTLDLGRTVVDDTLNVEPGEIGLTHSEIRHIALHDPAPVLRQVEAMRRVVDACEPDHRDAMESGDDSTALATDALRLLASIWSDHPDYRAEWRP